MLTLCESIRIFREVHSLARNYVTISQCTIIKLRANAWRWIGATETVINWITDGVPLAFESEPHPCEFNNQ